MMSTLWPLIFIAMQVEVASARYYSRQIKMVRYVQSVSILGNKLLLRNDIVLMTESWSACVTVVCIFGISSWVFLSRYARTTTVFDGFLVNKILRLSVNDVLLSLVNFR